MLDSISHLVSFIYSAEEGGFSAAARRLGLSPAAVSKNVAALERQLGVRLFQRTTRQLHLTEQGEQFLREVAEPWRRIEGAVQAAREGAAEPAGTLKISMAPMVGRTYFVPMLEDFRTRYPGIVPDLYFENRQVDVIGEGFDVGIGGGIALSEGLVARELTRVHVVAVASPAYLARHGRPAHPGELQRHEGIARRSVQTGRRYAWSLRQEEEGEEVAVEFRTVAVADDPEAMAMAAVAGVGLTLLPMPHALPFLRSGELVHLLPGWYTLAKPLCIYYPSRRLLPAKTRVFVDFVVERFRETGLAEQFRAPG
ncbi:LysR family transcriptional regulator [Massilia sp. KIM]|uniref:LysR family transcriptional regulator n=1 Tax=Massilia sp. KIM TaxID=1955422 RepID=UPI00098EB9A0|nr:LysR family transcriptional regulator [Massilia sp. KIM]OON61960.1 LysR family transcriptional regulator [Massilia sp. KIM]